MCRSSTLAGLELLEPRVMACFEAGALATGSQRLGSQSLAPVYSHMESDLGLLAEYRANAEALGRTFELDDADAPRPTFSTDMANVSLAVPDHPPPGGHRCRRLGQPPARVRRRLHHPVGRRRGPGRCAVHGLDGDRRRRPGLVRDRLLAGRAG